MNTLTKLSALFLLLCSMFLFFCDTGVSDPKELSSDKTKYCVDIPAEIDADLYRISVIDSSDTIIYYEKASTNKIQVSLPSDASSKIVVEAFKNNISIYVGGAEILSENPSTITLKKIEVVDIPRPENFTCQLTSENKVSLFWSPVNGAAAYRILRAENIPEVWSILCQISDIQYTDNSVAAGLKYFYKLIATGNDKESPETDVIEVKIPDGSIDSSKLPETPVNVHVTANADLSTLITWSIANRAESYAVYRFSSETAPGEKIGNSTSDSYTDSPREPGSRFGYAVEGVNGTGVSSLSEKVWITIPGTQTQKPQAPSGVTASAVSQTSIKVSWSAVSNADSYIVQYASLVDSRFNEQTSTETTLELGGLQIAAEYTLRVIAVNAVGQSVPSTDIKCTTLAKPVEKPSTPSNVNATALSERSINVTWDNVESATSYSVMYSTQVSGSFTTKTSAVNNYVIESLTASTTYYIKVAAINSAGSSELTSVVSARTLDPAAQAPSAPVLAAVMVSDTSIKISWSAVTNAASYIIERSLTTSGTYAAICTTSALAFTDTKCQPNTTYFYKGKATNSAGVSPYSAVASAKTNIRLSAPAGLTAGILTDSTIVISWQAGAGAASYKIYYSTSQSGTYPVHGTSSTTSYTLNKLTSATTYYIKVSSVAGTQESPASSVVSARTKESLPAIPAVPSGVTATSASTSSITVRFTAVTNATSYIIYNGQSSTSLKALDTITEVTFTHSSLTASTTYYYAVAAMNAAGTSAKSSVVSATTTAAVPSTPTGLTATATSSTSITVKFTAVTGVTGYKIYSSTNNSTFTVLSTLTSTTYTHSGLTANTTYYYKVSAVNGAIESAQSASVSAKTQAATTKVAVIGSSCNGCGRCPSACSRNAITRSGSKYIVDPAKCNGCGDCVRVCPRGAITLK